MKGFRRKVSVFRVAKRQQSETT